MRVVATSDIGASSRRRSEEVGRDIGRLKDYSYLQADLQEYITDVTGIGPVLQEGALAAESKSEEQGARQK